MKTLLSLSAVALLSFLIAHYTPTLDFHPEVYDIPLPAFDGPLKENSKLSETEHLFKGAIKGPESVIFHNGSMYAGLVDGRIVRFEDSKIITVTQTGVKCRMPYEERLCGRPLGLRTGKDGLLYIIDAYYGILKMNFTTGTLTGLLPSTVEVEGCRLVLPNDLDIDNDGNIYFSDSSEKWDLETVFYLLIEREGSGRIIRYNIFTGETKVLLRNLFLPNGVQLSKDKKSLLIAESSRRRILRYYIKGIKKGQREMFADGLPSEPDNIRSSARGYWVGFATARNHSNPLLSDRLNAYPRILGIWGKITYFFGTLFIALAEKSTSHTLKELAYKFRRGEYFLPFLQQHGIIIEFDEDGNILRSFHSPDGKTGDLSQVTEHEGYLYLGSFHNDYIGRLKL